jgi:hypothetical protein
MNNCSIRVSRDGVRYIANPDGNFLYDINDCNVRLHDSYKESQFKDWRRHYTASEIKSKCSRRIPKWLRDNYESSWYKEGDNVILSLIQHPNRTLSEAKFMLELDGLTMDDAGFAVKK